MHIAVLCCLSLLGSCAVWLYLARMDSNDCQVEKEMPFTLALKPKGKRLAFLLCMATVLIGISVWLEYTYRTNLLIDNAEIICLLLLLFAAANIDMRKQIIPNTLLLAGLIIRLILWIIALILDVNRFLNVVGGEALSCVGFGVFLIWGAVLTRGGIGMGDVKLIMLMALYQGFYGVISSLFFSLFAAFIIAITLLIARKKGKKDAIAFAPSILVGTLLSVFLTGM